MTTKMVQDIIEHGDAEEIYRLVRDYSLAPCQLKDILKRDDLTERTKSMIKRDLKYFRDLHKNDYEVELDDN